MARRSEITIGATLLLLVHSIMPAQSQLSSTAIESIVRKVMEDASLSVTNTQREGEYLVSTYSPKERPDNDLKIDSMLIASEIYKGDPKFTELTVHYYDLLSHEQYRSVNVRTTDVRAFGTGAIDKDMLLRTIKVEKKESAEPTLKSTDTTPTTVAASETNNTQNTAIGTLAKVESAPVVKPTTDNRKANSIKDDAAAPTSGEPKNGASSISAKTAPATKPGASKRASQGGFTLSYPPNWLTNRGEQDGSVICVYPSEASHSFEFIDLCHHPADTPELACSELATGVWMGDLHRTKSSAGWQGWGGGQGQGGWGGGQGQGGWGGGQGQGNNNAGGQGASTDSGWESRGDGWHRKGDNRPWQGDGGQQQHPKWNRKAASAFGKALSWVTQKTNVVAIKVPKTIKFGTGNTFTGLQVACYYDETEPEGVRKMYERCIYFGWPHRVYVLRVRCDKAHAAVMNTTFEKLLSSFAIQPTK